MCLCAEILAWKVDIICVFFHCEKMTAKQLFSSDFQHLFLLEWLQELNQAVRLPGLGKIFVYQIPKEIK